MNVVHWSWHAMWCPVYSVVDATDDMCGCGVLDELEPSQDQEEEDE